MDTNRFDAAVRALRGALSRRGALAGIAAAFAASGAASAWNGKKPQPNRNEIGCVNVGGLCFGKGVLCCSERCQGKKLRRGKKDRRRCAAHDVSTCELGQDACNGPIAPCVKRGRRLPDDDRRLPVLHR